MREFKKGTKVLIKKTKHGASCLEGKICTVESGTTNRGGNIIVSPDEGVPNGSNWTIYRDEDFCLADRKDQAKFLREKVISMRKEIRSILVEVERLEKFDSEEAYTAHKLKKLFDAKDDEAAMAEILKTLKETNFI